MKKCILSALLVLTLLCAMTPVQAATVMGSEEATTVETPQGEEAATPKAEAENELPLPDVPAVAEPESEEPANLLETYSGTCGDNLTWAMNTSTGLLTISGTGKMKDYSSDSPAPWFSYCDDITSVVIADGVTSVGAFAFINYTNLASIAIPDSVTSIGYAAFRGCASLTSIDIPSSDVCIWSFAFAECTSLISIDLSHGSFLLDEELSGYVFMGCTSLTCVVLPETLTSIPYGWFADCTKLAVVGIPQTVTQIDDTAFKGCTNLSRIYYSGTKPQWDAIYGVYVSKELCGARLLCNSTVPMYTISYDANGGSEAPSSQTKTQGIALALSGAIPTRPGYVFRGWSNKSTSNRAEYQPLDFFTTDANTTLYAVWECGGTCGNNLTWTINTDTGKLSIDGTGPMRDYKLSTTPWNSYRDIISSVTIGNGVTSIGSSSFAKCTYLTNVTIPDSVTSIGNAAFTGCISLDGVTILDGVTSIGSTAFSGCTSLTSITIPNSVTNIGNWAFAGCESLTGIRVTANNPNYCSADGVLFNKSRTVLIQYPGQKEGAYAIPNSVIEIGERAFYYCTNLTNVTIPDGVTCIGQYAFSHCTSLTGINVATSNPNYCSVDGVLFSKDKATLIRYPGGKAGTYTIPNSVTSIGHYAFTNCTSLTGITIPNSVTSIGAYAFDGCTSPISITIPDSVTNIESSAFYDCTGLTSITIGTGVTSIGAYAFDGCTNLTNVIIPGSVTSIGQHAFSHCTNLTSIIIPDSVTSIESCAFDNCTGLTNITIGKGVTNIGGVAFDRCASLTAITVDSANTAYCSEAGVLFNKEKTTLIQYPCGKKGAYTIPSSVTSIVNTAFRYCTGLTSVTILGSVTYIGFGTFEGCTHLISIVIPNSVTEIAYGAFNGCVYLSGVYYGGSKAEWNAVTVAMDNDPLKAADIHYNCAPHTVTFDPNGGSVDLSQKVVINNMTYGVLPVPSRNGYVFDGWYTAITGGQLVQGANTVRLTGDQTLYAHWTSQFSYLPVVTTNEATNIGTTSATLSGTVRDNGGNEITSRQIVYWSKDNTAKRHTETAGQDFSRTLTGLTPSTTYFFYAKAANSSGEGTGDLRSFTTGWESQPISISLSPTYLSLDSGDTYQLAVTVLPATAPDRSVVWASSNRSVATVDSSGNVTAVSGGEATVTATTVANGLTATCKVKVATQEDLAGSFDFSEWHMASATSTLNTTDGFDLNLGSGGNFQMATAYLARWGGAVLEKNDPYRAYGDGVYNSALSSNYHVQEAIWLPARTGSNDNAEYKAAVMNYGAAYVYFRVDGRYFTSNQKNYYFPNSDATKEGGHAVAVVGWDDNYPASNFTVTPPGNGAFICKNSWGTNSGEDGYFYISYYDKYLGSGGGAVFPKIETNSNYNTIYQYDPLGACTCLMYDRQFYAANVFPQSGKTLRQSEKLRAVSFYTQSKNTSYEVYVITDYQSKDSLHAGGTAVASGTFQEMGYHTVNLDAPITLAAGTRFAVIVKLSVADGEAAMYYEYPQANYSSKARANADESYYSPDGISWGDLTGLVENANFCIKAFTDNAQASYSTQLFEAIDNEARAYESDKVYSLDDALQAGIPVNPDFIKWVKEREMDEETAILAAAESEPSLGAIPSLTTVSGNSISFVTGIYLPTRYDLRDEGCVTDVRDQGKWGNCWAFACYASLESCLLKKTKSVPASFGASNALDTLASMTQGGASVGGDTNIDNVQIVDGTLNAVIGLADGFDGAAAYLAVYSQGRMTDIQWAALAPGRQNVSFPVSTDADSVKLFVLSSDSAPLCKAYQVDP